MLEKKHSERAHTFGNVWHRWCCTSHFENLTRKMSCSKTSWVVSFRRFHNCVTSFTYRELAIVWNKNFIRTECRIPLRVCFSSCELNSKVPLDFRSDHPNDFLKEKAELVLAGTLSASCFVVSICEREGYCPNKKNLRTLSLSEKIQLWYAYTVVEKACCNWFVQQIFLTIVISAENISKLRQCYPTGIRAAGTTIRYLLVDFFGHCFVVR